MFFGVFLSLLYQQRLCEATEMRRNRFEKLKCQLNCDSFNLLDDGEGRVVTKVIYAVEGR